MNIYFVLKWNVSWNNNISGYHFSGDSQTGIHKRSVYEHNGIAVCSQKRALFIAVLVMATLFTISLIIAYAGPQAGKDFA